MDERNSFNLILNSKIISVPFVFDGLLNINHQIVNHLISFHKYNVKSNIDFDILESFINFWVYGKIPDIQSKNIDDYDKLNQEFQHQDLKNLIQMKKEFSDKFIDLNKIQLATPQNKLKIIEIISENLDDYLKHYGIELFSLPIDTLTQIFTHPKRSLEFHDFAYEMIHFYYKKTKKIEIFSLLPTLEASKLSERNYEDSMHERKSRNNFIAQINISDFMDKVEETKKNYAKNFQSFLDEISTNENYRLKNLLAEAFKNEDNELFNLLIGKLVYFDELGIKLIINEKNKEASIFSFKNTCSTLIIPRAIRYNSEDMLIKRILQGSFEKAQIKTIKFEENSELKKIDKYAFAHSLIEEIFIPSKLVQIDDYAFYQCDELKYIHINENSQLKTIGEGAFENTSIKSIFIPSCFEEFKNNWCNGAQKLERIIVSPENKRFYFDKSTKMLLGKSNNNNNNYDVILFGSRTLKNTVLIHSNIKEISASAFEHCNQLKQVIFEKNSELRVIGELAFSATSIESILIPPTVYIIKYDAFSYCYNLKRFEVDSNSKVIKISAGVFVQSNVETIDIPSDFVDLEDQWCLETPNLRRVLIPPKNKQFFFNEKNHFLLTKSDMKSDNYDVILFASRYIENAVIPSNIKIIGSAAFQNCIHLKVVTFEENSMLNTIDDFVFYNTPFERIVIPPTVKRLGELSFAMCLSLKKVYISNDSELEEIDDCAFDCSVIEDIFIPSKVKKISHSAFSTCENLRIVEFDENPNLDFPSICKALFKDPSPIILISAKKSP
ncbi:hypothetical protein M9Y10_014034 [Tritrichomonas musculus]|uniref:Uncharacterized protein n=1 Tax=Tritrichomonas musculus TaxID=1915356 RepID=A0ABR2KYF1_9EUKA